jgi:metal-responsive CopG/Arc/MetJ family transcriptional regulator
MSRITVTLPEDLATLLAREAERVGTSISDLVRRAVAAELGRVHGERGKVPFASLGRSGHRHTARDAEHILAREWGRARRR